MSSGEANIIEFISSLEDYSGAIPDQVIEYYLQRTGFSSQDIKVKRLIGIAAQKFVSDLIHDSLQYCKLRQDGKKDKKTVLSMEDLAQSASEYGITIKKPEYYSDKPGSLSGPNEMQQ